MPLSCAVSWNLLKFMYIESVMLPNHLIFCWSLLLLPSIFPSITVFQWVGLQITWPKYWSYNFIIRPSNEYSGLISYRTDWFDLLAVQGTPESSPALTFEIISSSVLCLLYGPTLTLCMMTGKKHSFYCVDLCQQSNVSTL